MTEFRHINPNQRLITFAEELYQVPREELTPNQMTAARHIRFNMIYGRTLTVADLERANKPISHEEAEAIVKGMKEQFPELNVWAQQLNGNIPDFVYKDKDGRVFLGEYKTKEDR